MLAFLYIFVHRSSWLNCEYLQNTDYYGYAKIKITIGTDKINTNVISFIQEEVQKEINDWVIIKDSGSVKFITQEPDCKMEYRRKSHNYIYTPITIR